MLQKGSFHTHRILHRGNVKSSLNITRTWQGLMDNLTLCHPHPLIQRDIWDYELSKSDRWPVLVQTLMFMEDGVMRGGQGNDQGSAGECEMLFPDWWISVCFADSRNIFETGTIYQSGLRAGWLAEVDVLPATTRAASPAPDRHRRSWWRRSAQINFPPVN